MGLPKYRPKHPTSKWGGRFPLPPFLFCWKTFMSFRQNAFVLGGFIAFICSFFQKEKLDALSRSLKAFVIWMCQVSSNTFKSWYEIPVIPDTCISLISSSSIPCVHLHETVRTLCLQPNVSSFPLHIDLVVLAHASGLWEYFCLPVNPSSVAVQDPLCHLFALFLGTTLSMYYSPALLAVDLKTACCKHHVLSNCLKSLWVYKTKMALL